MKDYKYIDEYLNILVQDLYPQPSDDGHDMLLNQAMQEWEAYLLSVEKVLDVGCGEDVIAFPYFSRWGVEYLGVSLDGGDKVNTRKMDMSFLEFEDNSFGGIFARHVLEHSPMPLLTLMEWHRVSNKYLFLILPNPDHFGYIGRNHYSVMSHPQINWLLRRAGWKILEKSIVPEEFRFICEKMPLLSYEGYVEAPLDSKVYEKDRDE